MNDEGALTVGSTAGNGITIAPYRNITSGTITWPSATKVCSCSRPYDECCGRAIGHWHKLLFSDWEEDTCWDDILSEDSEMGENMRYLYEAYIIDSEDDVEYVEPFVASNKQNARDKVIIGAGIDADKLEEHEIVVMQITNLRSREEDE